MDFRTIVAIEEAAVKIEPLVPLLFVGSCFADSIGRRFAEERFPATVNPYGVMYNPASVLHTVERWVAEQDHRVPPFTFLTLGTNHVYRLRETGEIVDNCQKRPQRLFREEVLTVEQCVGFLAGTVEALRRRRDDAQVIVTVSPIRYAKYGFHGSQLSKATLLMAADELVGRYPGCVTYFPAYEIVLDELRDYRFYQPDMLHPSAQTVEYIWERLTETLLSARARQFLAEWKPVKQALAHRPFHPESMEYRQFMAETRQREQDLLRRYGHEPSTISK